MLHKRLLSLISLFIVGMAMILALPISVGAIANPNSTSIGDVAIFRDLVKSGDQLWFMRYDISYGSVPSEDAEDTFCMAIYTSGDVFTGYSRPLNYYQHNIISIYLTPGQALVWGGTYKVRVMGNPALFSLSEGVNMRTRTVGSGDYHELVDLGGFLISQAGILETDWGITLLTSNDKLNTTGSFYFIKAINGLNNICPEIFQVTTSVPELPSDNWTEEGFEYHKGPNLNTTLTGLSDWLGISTTWAGLGITVMLAGLLGSTAYGSTRNSVVALMVASLALPIVAWIGLFSVTLWVLVVVLVAILFAIVFIHGRFG